MLAKNYVISKTLAETAKRRHVMKIRQEQAIQFWFKLVDGFIACAIGATVLCLYVYTLAPTIVAGDAGELVTAAFELGIAHPPGYPLWCLLSHIFITLFLNITDVAYRVNLFSAICGSSTCALLYFVARQLNLNRISAIAGALLLGVSREFWAQSVIAEVYALNALLFVMCLFCLVRWYKEQNNRWLLGFSFILGLGLTNHHTIAIIGPIGLCFVLWKNWKIILNWKFVILAIILFLLPLTLYIYLPLRSATAPYMDWGHPVTLKRMWAHISRAQYKLNYHPLPRNISSIVFQLTILIRYFFNQFSPIIGFLSLVFIPVNLIYRRQERWWAIWILFIGIMLTFSWLLNTKFERQEIEANKVFFIPAYCCSVLLIAATLESASHHVTRFFRSRLPAEPASILCLTIVLIPCFVALKYNFTANNFSKYWYAEDHARNILSTMERGGVIFPSGDHNTFPLIYLHYVEKQRPDIVIADKYGYVEARDFPEIKSVSSDKSHIPKSQVIRYLLTKTNKPVYFTVKWNIPRGLNVHQIQMGILYRVSSLPPQKNPAEVWKQYYYQNINDGFSNPLDYGAINIVSDYFYFRAVSLLKHKDINNALTHFALSARLAHGIKEVYNNIGSALAEQGLLNEALSYYKYALLLDKDYISALWNIARTCMASGNRKAAIDYFQQLYKVTPHDFRIPGELGFLNINCHGNTRKAQEYFLASLKLNPNQPQIKKILNELKISLENNRVSKGLKLNRRVHDFGKVPIKTSTHTFFEITNTLNKPVIITDIQSDCGCTVPTIPSKNIGPGQTVRLTVRFQENKTFGYKNKRVTITASTGQKLALQIKAYVVPRFSITPDNLTIPDAVPRKLQQRVLYINSFGNKPFTIKAIKSTLSEITPITEKHLHQLVSKHKLSFKILPTLEIGHRTGKLMIYIDNEEQDIVTVPVSLFVRYPVTITPRSIFLSSVKREGTKTVHVSLNIPHGWHIKVTDVVSSANWFHIENPPTQLEGKSSLTIIVDTNKLPQSFKGTLSLYTNHPSIPKIVIPIYGFVSQ